MKKVKIYLVVTMILFISCGPNPQQLLINRNQELEKQNSQLKKLLEKKLTSLCDTTSLERKLKEQELENFEIDCYQRVEDFQIKLAQLKESEQMKLIKKKEQAEIEIFENWQDTMLPILKAMTRQQDFAKYAIAELLCSYSYSDFYEDRLESKKPLTIQKFLKQKNTAQEKKEKAREAVQKKFEESINSLDKKYKEGLEKIEEQIKKEIDEKKVELGI